MKGWVGSFKLGEWYGTILPEDGGTGQTVEIPGIQIYDYLGTGANGVVFAATDAIQRDVVIKVYPPRLDRPDFELGTQAYAEAEKVALLKHSGLATLYRYGTLGEEAGFYPGMSLDQWPYTVQEYCPGRQLKDVLPALSADLQKRLVILGRVFEILSYAESRGVLHGDLHGGNVLVEQIFDRVDAWVIDFGTSVISGRPFSEARHARLLREFTYSVLPELAGTFQPTSRLLRRAGLAMLPRLRAALTLFQLTEGPGAVELSPRQLGSELAYATDFNFVKVWDAVQSAVPSNFMLEVKKSCLEFLTHDHALEHQNPAPAELDARLAAALSARNVEPTSITD